ncbi:ABC transporter ATP-binding protein [Cohnella sp. GCM10012308]|uniref:ABC transporter ATP-binding protein n=1 Tax=Cohnella sp. GCM10012308 TaxID=3317329 RepID=UPI00360A4E4A
MELDRIKYSYDRKTDQLKEVTATIDAGRMTGIIGPNGSGKSTLLGVMARSIAPQSGSAVLDGKALAAYKPRELARKLAAVHQHNGAPADLTVERIVAYGRLPHRKLLGQRDAEDEEAVDWAIACTGLTEKRKQRIGELSGGERQRVWIAMALAQKTQVLLLDEPTTFLDMYYQIELMELIRGLNVDHGLTIVVVLHDMNQAVRYCDRIIAMKEGRVVLQGPPEEAVTAQTIKDIYGVEALVRRDEEAGMYIVPLRAGSAASGQRRQTIEEAIT